MKYYDIRIYNPSDYAIWNTFVAKAKNATFLFHRDFMEYHSDRFSDFSLMIFDGEKFVALLPANKNGNALFSHQGLTYGGLVYSEKLKLENLLDVFNALILYLKENEIDTLHLKMIPNIYHKKPASELDYAMFLANAKLVRKDTLSVIDLSKGFDVSEIRKRGIKKSVENNLVIKEETDFESFWNEILIPNLKAKHNANPVHSIEEIIFLKSKFPQNIRQFNVYHNEKIVGGTTIFETETVAHAQYISANESRNDLGSLDFLFHHLITNVFKQKQWFDFGISNENQGRKLNTGLSYWKESFGAGTMVQDFYEMNITDFQPLDFRL